MHSVAKKKQGVLGGHVYVVQEVQGGHRVFKITQENADADDPGYIVENGRCECKASTFNGECKHARMVDGSLRGEEVPRHRALQALEGFLDKIRAEWPRGKVVSLMPYAPARDGRITRGTALACGVGNDASPERMTIWGESDGFLIVLHVLNDEERFRSAHAKARQAHRGATRREVDP